MSRINTPECFARLLKFFAIGILATLSLIPMGCTDSDVTPREGSVQGRVLDQSGSPLEDALVTWAYDNTRWCLTDEQGSFFIEAVGFGEQLFNIEAFGYRASQFKATIYSGHLTTVDDLAIEPKSFDYLEIEVEKVSATHALITWKTTDYTNGIIEFGETESLGRTVREPAGEYATVHSLTLEGLRPEKTYFFKIIASRENRPAETSEMGKFTTLNNLEDQTSPSAPTNVEAALTSSPNMVTVFWAPVSDLDLKGYKVYRAENANAAFNQISNMLIPKGQERYTDVSVIPGKKYFYRVTAIDQAGNESGFHNIANMLVPGDIATEVTWTRANSPYIIAGDITVHETGRINIDSGVEVLIESFDSFRQKDPDRVDIIINGSLVASAGNQLPVIFASVDVNPDKDSWNGLSFENSENDINTLLNVRISDAPVAVSIKSSNGIFRQIEIINSETAIKANNNTNLSLEALLTRRCGVGLEAAGNKNLVIKDSTFFHPGVAINSNNNDGLTISGNNFLEYTDTGLLSNEAGQGITITNNLFVAPAATALKTMSNNPVIEYNTFDSPYAIQIAQGNPVIRKNILIADRSLFKEGKKAIEHLTGELPLPEFGPNNIYGFPAGNDYIGCTATADSTNEDVLLMRELTGDEYDYRLRQPYPDTEDPWGIHREQIPWQN